MLDGQVNGKCPTRHRKRQRRWIAFAKSLEHIKARQVPGVNDHLQAASEGLRLLERHHELILQEAVRAIDSVPLRHQIKRVEELYNVLQLTSTVLGRLEVPRRAEGLCGCLVDHAVGKDLRQRAEGGWHE